MLLRPQSDSLSAVPALFGNRSAAVAVKYYQSLTIRMLDFNDAAVCEALGVEVLNIRSSLGDLLAQLGVLFPVMLVVVCEDNYSAVSHEDLQLSQIYLKDNVIVDINKTHYFTSSSE